jgi:EAL domain-containing protein (putative c-di-GMP-specific phosphodiesterase class I)
MKEDRGKVMKIEISTNEYRDLLDILHIADVVFSGHRRAEDKRTERHRALIQKLYSLAQTAGLEQLITYNKSVNKYVPTDAFEQSALAHALIDEFGDHLFWDELISRLSVRDAAQIAGGVDRLNAMSDSDRQALEGPIRQRYVEELSANGVANLAVIQQFVTGRGMPVETSD